MKLSRESVHEATNAEREDCPGGHHARLRLAEQADPEGLHRIDPHSPVMAMSWTAGYHVEQHVESASGHAEVLEGAGLVDVSAMEDALMGPGFVPHRPRPKLAMAKGDLRARHAPDRLADEMTQDLFSGRKQKGRKARLKFVGKRVPRKGARFQAVVPRWEEPTRGSHALTGGSLAGEAATLTADLLLTEGRAATLIEDPPGNDLHTWPRLGFHAPETIIFMCADPGYRWHFCVAGTLFELPRKLHHSVRVYIPYPRATYHGSPPTVDGSENELGHGNVGCALVTRCVAPTTTALAVLRRQHCPSLSSPPLSLFSPTNSVSLCVLPRQRKGLDACPVQGARKLCACSAAVRPRA